MHRVLAAHNWHCRHDHHHLRYQKLRIHEEGLRLARPQRVAYHFYDYKAAGAPKDKLKQWSDKLGWDSLLNRAGTTFRKLPDADKVGLNEQKALALMLAQPSIIKRPVLELGDNLLVGFKPEIYAREVTAAGKSRTK